jgi:hypothetical protein
VGRRRKLSDDEKTAIVEAYTQPGGTVQSVAKDLHISQQVIIGALKDEGIQRKQPGRNGAGGCPRCSQPEGVSHLPWCNG